MYIFDEVYRQEADGKVVRVTNELALNLFRGLHAEFESGHDFLSGQSSRVTEKQIYAMLVKGLVLELVTKVNNFEPPEIERGLAAARDLRIFSEVCCVPNDNSNNVNRFVDFLIEYRECAFLVEVKLAGLGIGKLREDTRGGELWHKLIEQLKGVSADEQEWAESYRKIIKFPFAVFPYFSSADLDAGDVDAKIIEKHDSVFQSLGGESGSFRPAYHAVFKIKPQERQNRRGQDIATYAVGFFAGCQGIQ